MNRRGMEPAMLFLVPFFALLLVIALALLFMDKANFETMRPQLGDDLAQQHADTLLLGVLRQPVRVDVNGDGVLDTITFADFIVLSEGQESNEQLRKQWQQALPQTDFVASVKYVNGKEVTISCNEKTKGFFSAVLDRIPQSSTILPGRGGNIEVRLAAVNEEQLFTKVVTREGDPQKDIALGTCGDDA